MFRNSNAKEDAASLLVAAEKGHVTVIGELLKRNAKNPKFLEARNTFGNTALMVAAFWGQEAVVKQLLEAKADINTRNNKDITPLMVAAVSGHVAILAELLNRKPELLEAHDSVGDTALIVAAFCGHKAVVEKLLEANAKVNVKDKEGKTAFTHAVESLVNHCLKKDATVETKEDRVKSDKVSNYWQILKLLIKKGADTVTLSPLTEKVASVTILNEAKQQVSLAEAIQAERDKYTELQTLESTNQRTLKHG